MKQIKYIYGLCYLILISVSNAQSINLKGIVLASGETAGIHVLNNSAKKYTITTAGGLFEVPAKLNDTILFRSVQYQPYQLIVDQRLVATKFVEINMTDRLNELDEVIVGKILTGDLLSDIENSNAKSDINFYDVGIPGYTGKLKTQSERKFAEADSGKFIYYYGIAAVINVHKILNRISGRTKEMKERVLLEEQTSCINRTRAEFSELLFGNQDFENHLIHGFFMYVAEDSKFDELCKSDNNLGMYEFLVGKLLEFQSSDELLED